MAASTSTAIVSFREVQALEYYVKPEMRFHARANLYFHPSVCDVIKKHLSTDDYDKMVLSSVGIVLSQGNKLKYDFQLVHHMLMHEVKTSKKRELWFKVGGHLARFSKAEFAAVSGLPCKKYLLGPPQPVSCLNFFGQKRVSLHDLTQMFINEPVSSPKKIIMARVMLVEELINYRRAKLINEDILAFACDPERFDKYDWGTTSYDYLYPCLKKCAEKGKNVTDLELRQCYDMSGYGPAFHMWILEAFPKISNEIDCSFAVHNNNPFSLHWESQENHKFDQCKPLFSMHMEVVFPTYGEFVKTNDMAIDEDVADERVDVMSSVPDALFNNIVVDGYQPLASLNPKCFNDVYYVRKARIWYHIEKERLLTSKRVWDAPYKATGHQRNTNEIEELDEYAHIILMVKEAYEKPPNYSQEEIPISLRKRGLSRACKGSVSYVVEPEAKKQKKVVVDQEQKKKKKKKKKKKRMMAIVAASNDGKKKNVVVVEKKQKKQLAVVAVPENGKKKVAVAQPIQNLKKPAVSDDGKKKNVVVVEKKKKKQMAVVAVPEDGKEKKVAVAQPIQNLKKPAVETEKKTKKVTFLVKKKVDEIKRVDDSLLQGNKDMSLFGGLDDLAIGGGEVDGQMKSKVNNDNVPEWGKSMMDKIVALEGSMFILRQSKDVEINQLRERVRQLESVVKELQKDPCPSTEQVMQHSVINSVINGVLGDLSGKV